MSVNIRLLTYCYCLLPSLFLSGSYSNLSLLYVTGLIRLDPCIEASSAAVSMPGKEFENIWPTKEDRKAALIATKKHFKDQGLSGYINPYFYMDEEYFHY